MVYLCYVCVCEYWLRVNNIDNDAKLHIFTACGMDSNIQYSTVQM